MPYVGWSREEFFLYLFRVSWQSQNNKICFGSGDVLSTQRGYKSPLLKEQERLSASRPHCHAPVWGRAGFIVDIYIYNIHIQIKRDRGPPVHGHRCRERCSTHTGAQFFRVAFWGSKHVWIYLFRDKQKKRRWVFIDVSIAGKHARIDAIQRRLKSGTFIFYPPISQWTENTRNLDQVEITQSPWVTCQTLSLPSVPWMVGARVLYPLVKRSDNDAGTCTRQAGTGAVSISKQWSGSDASLLCVFSPCASFSRWCTKLPNSEGYPTSQSDNQPLQKATASFTWPGGTIPAVTPACTARTTGRISPCWHRKCPSGNWTSSSLFWPTTGSLPPRDGGLSGKPGETRRTWPDCRGNAFLRQVSGDNYIRKGIRKKE